MSEGEGEVSEEVNYENIDIVSSNSVLLSLNSDGAKHPKLCTKLDGSRDKLDLSDSPKEGDLPGNVTENVVKDIRDINGDICENSDVEKVNLNVRIMKDGRQRHLSVDTGLDFIDIPAGRNILADNLDDSSKTGSQNEIAKESCKITDNSPAKSMQAEISKN